MKCSQVRSLFSARLDNELDTATAARVSAHVDRCRKCSMHWDSLATTVRMVRGLPEISPDPSFVGKVLDRVRAHEAGRIDLEPIRESAPGLWGRLVARLSDLAIPVPVRMAGALAMGAVVGVLLAGPDRVILFGDQSGPDRAGGTYLAASPSAVSQPTASESRSGIPHRPFGDLLDELALSPQVDQQGTSEAEGAGRHVPGALLSDPVGPSRQVRLDEADGRPQITF